MIEVVIKNYLLDILDVPVVLERPKDVPTSYVLMRLIDSGEINHISSATFIFEVVAGSLYEASVLSDELADALDGIVILDKITKAFPGGKSAETDSSDKTYKYILTYNFNYYKEE